jgi:hypothetical protein
MKINNYFIFFLIINYKLLKRSIVYNGVNVIYKSLDFYNFFYTLKINSKNRFSNFIVKTLQSVLLVKYKKNKSNVLFPINKEQEELIERDNIFMHSNFTYSKVDLVDLIKRKYVKYSLRLVEKFPFSLFMPLRMQLINE